MINISLKEMSDRTSRWLPAFKPYFQNYVNAMITGNLGRAILNTWTIVFFSVLIVAVGAMAAYPPVQAWDEEKPDEPDLCRGGYDASPAEYTGSPLQGDGDP